LLLQCRADVNLGDTFRHSGRWLHLVNDPRLQGSMYAMPSRLDRSLLLSGNLISIRKDGAEGTIAQIWKDHRAAIIRVRGNDMTDARFTSGSIAELPEQLRPTKLRRIFGSSSSQVGATDSLSILGFMLRRLRDNTIFSGFWRYQPFGMPLRRNLNRLLRPRVPQNHVRLTWICVRTLLQLA
jgi:hypothetical protein